MPDRERHDRLDARSAMNTGTKTTVHRMKTTLNSAGDEAGMKNRRSALSMPMNAAATATSSRNGMLTRVSAIVSASLAGHVCRNPRRRTPTSGSANTMPSDDERAGDERAGR